ncbi:B3 domain-containing protein REM10-like [Nicotiana tomentosiformis]|uniref:B3 domain-containing protein REM10-like n=1 Tax=Nicotiana tomentosiformis TaxID=4098 RepID=UPI00388C39E0
MDKAHPLSTPMVVRSLEVHKDLFQPPEEDEELLGPEVPYLSAIGAPMLQVAHADSLQAAKEKPCSGSTTHWINVILLLLTRDLKLEKIPIAFSKYLNGCNQEHAILRRADMKETWSLKFQSLVQVNVKENMNSLLKELMKNKRKTIILLNTTEKPKLNIKSSHKAFPNVEAAQDMLLGRPHFICTIKPYCLSKNFLQLSDPFAQEDGLRNRRCTITIRDEQMSWTFKLYSSVSHTFIGGVWSKFYIANGFKEGDQIMLVIVANGNNPILKKQSAEINASAKQCQIFGVLRYYQERITGLIKTSDMPATKAQVPSSTSANANPHFISTIRPYFISRPSLYLPAAFAKSNGLANKCRQMILRDEKQRLWPVQIGPVGHQFSITRGWRQFREANNVQVGDTY